MSLVPNSTLADLRQTVADILRANGELQRRLDERTAERDTLQRELVDAKEEQAAPAEVLQVINSSPGDLAPVFDAMLEKAMRLCEATFGALGTWQGEEFRFVAGRGEPRLEFLVENRISPPGSRAGYNRVARGDGYIELTDISTSKFYETGAPAVRAAVDLGGARTTLTVPLANDNEALGLLILHRQEVRPFTERQIALVRNFAAQAVIAMENARLITETREALEQQTATAEILQVINSSPGDLAPVFDAMLEKATALCEAAFGTLFTYSGHVFHAVALHNVPAAFAASMDQPVRPSSPGAALHRLLHGERFAHFHDVTVEDAYAASQDARRLVELGGARSLLGVPLRKEGAFLGAIIVYRQEVRPFTEKQIVLLENFATQAVIAMENARLITETREALEQQTATAEVLGVINSSPGDLAPVFDAILEKAHSLCGATFGSLQTYDGEYFRAVAVRGGPEPFAELMRQPFRPPGEGPMARLLAGEPFIQIADLAELVAQGNDNPRTKGAVELGGVRTVLFVPLRKDAELLGYISAQRQDVRPFTDKQIALLQNFAAQAVIAMENARLLGELRQRTEEVSELNRGLEARVAEQVDELGRVGRLKRFLAPQLAELIVSQGDEKILESHRREIVVVFCDLRGYTAFTETAEPEEVLDFLREYHGALGPLVSQFEGTLDQFSGDGIMVFFNDPVPIPDSAERAVKMAVAMREAAGALIAVWRRRDRELGFGAGIAQGYATLGQIGFAERSGYTAIGTVCNLAARLCAEAKDGQILISGRVAAAIEKVMPLEDFGSLALKGLNQPVSAFNVPFAVTPPALRVIEGGPQSV